MLGELSLDARNPKRVEDPFHAVEALPFFSPFDDWDAGLQTQYLRLANQSPKHRELLLARLTAESGQLFALMTLDRELFSKIRILQEHLREEDYHGIPYLDQPLRVGHAFLLAKTFDSPDRIDAFLDSYAPHQIDDRLKSKKSACLALHSDFNQKDNVTGSISLQFRSALDDASNPKDDYYVHCELSISGLEGEWRTEAKLHSLELDESLQAKGAGSKRFAHWLLWCLEQEAYGVPVESISLRANIDVGGYAWALYGFDFDQEAWVYAPPSEEERRRRHQLSSQERRREIITPILDSSDQLLNYLEQDVSGLSHTTFFERTHLSLNMLRRFLYDPETCEFVTPDAIAALGFEEQTIARSTNGSLYVGEIPPHETLDRRGHIGKFFMLGSSWLGRLPLQPSDPRHNPALKQALQRLHIAL